MPITQKQQVISWCSTYWTTALLSARFISVLELDMKYFLQNLALSMHHKLCLHERFISRPAWARSFRDQFVYMMCAERDSEIKACRRVLGTFSARDQISHVTLNHSNNISDIEQSFDMHNPYMTCSFQVMRVSTHSTVAYQKP